MAGLGLSINTGDLTPSSSDGTEFGSTNLNTDSVVHSFTIANHGSAVLHLGGSPRVLISGAHASDFVVTAQPSAAVNPSSSTSFGILFRPSSTGLRTATVTIANDDSDEGPYKFTVQGTGVAVASPFAHNLAYPQDVNADAKVTTGDLLILANNLLRGPVAVPQAAGSTSSSSYYLDVTGDGRLTSSDLLAVVNYLLKAQAASAAAPQAVPQAAGLVLFDDLADPATEADAPRVERYDEESEERGTAASPRTAPLLPQAVNAALDTSQDHDSTDEELFAGDLLALKLK